MKTLLPLVALALAACTASHEGDGTPRIDTSSGLLATASTRVDSTPASVVPRTPLVGPESVTMVRGTGSADVAAALRGDTAVALALPESLAAMAPAVVAAPAPANAPPASDLDALRRAMQVPVAGIAPTMLRDSWDELRGGTRRHDALDIPAPRGTPVLSATAGRVLRLFDSKAGGRMVYATDSTERFILMYGHLDAYQPGLAAGQPLRRGQPLGTVGTSGNAPPTVPHLHFAIARTTNVKEWWKGVPVNPYPLLKP